MFVGRQVGADGYDAARSVAIDITIVQRHQRLRVAVYPALRMVNDIQRADLFACASSLPGSRAILTVVVQHVIINQTVQASTSLQLPRPFRIDCTMPVAVRRRLACSKNCILTNHHWAPAQRRQS